VKAFHLSLLIAYSGLIFYLSHQSSLAAPMLFAHQDKLFHAGAYAVLAVLSLNYVKCLTRSFKLALCVAFIFSALYGISDEWHQSFIIGRDASVLDWLADCVGALIALACYRQKNIFYHHG